MTTFEPGMAQNAVLRGVLEARGDVRLRQDLDSNSAGEPGVLISCSMPGLPPCQVSTI